MAGSPVRGITPVFKRSGNSGDFSTVSPQDRHSTIGEWAVTSYDMPSTLKSGYNYELPFGAGKRFNAHSRIVNQMKR